jgi:predicted O-linked N-acetylglucosamine transferase (SPINDLY family)
MPSAVIVVQALVLPATRSCITVDADDYVEKAKIFSSDLPGLARLRWRLRRQLLQSSLFDGKRFGKQFEQALVNALQSFSA